MANYKEKPAQVDAIQYDGANLTDVVALIGGKVKEIGGKPFVRNAGGRLIEVVTDSWVLKGQGDVFQLNNARFTRLYEVI